MGFFWKIPSKLFKSKAFFSKRLKSRFQRFRRKLVWEHGLVHVVVHPSRSKNRQVLPTLSARLSRSTAWEKDLSSCLVFNYTRSGLRAKVHCTHAKVVIGKWTFLRRCICAEGRSKCVMEGIVNKRTNWKTKGTKKVKKRNTSIMVGIVVVDFPNAG